MAQIETWFSQDLQQAVKVHYIDGNIFSADNNGNIIGVNVFDDGEPATLGGTVSASIIRADGATVAATGTLSGNQVSVALPQSAYAVPGVISIVLKLTSGTTVTTLLAVVGNVYQSATDTVVDPGTILPSIETLIAAIEAAVASIPADYSSLWASLAPAFRTDTSYATGQYVTYNGSVYRFTSPHPAGPWSASGVAAKNIGYELTRSNNSIFANETRDSKFETAFANSNYVYDFENYSGYVVDYAIGAIATGLNVGDAISFGTQIDIRHFYIPVTPGDIYRATMRKPEYGTYTYCVAFTDDNGVIVELLEPVTFTIDVITKMYVAPTGATRMYIMSRDNGGTNTSYTNIYKAILNGTVNALNIAGAIENGYWLDYTISSKGGTAQNYRSIAQDLEPGEYTITFGANTDLIRICIDGGYCDQTVSLAANEPFSFRCLKSGRTGFSFVKPNSLAWGNTWVQLEKTGVTFGKHGETAVDYELRKQAKDGVQPLQIKTMGKNCLLNGYYNGSTYTKSTNRLTTFDFVKVRKGDLVYIKNSEIAIAFLYFDSNKSYIASSPYISEGYFSATAIEAKTYIVEYDGYITFNMYNRVAGGSASIDRANYDNFVDIINYVDAQIYNTYIDTAMRANMRAKYYGATIGGQGGCVIGNKLYSFSDGVSVAGAINIVNLDTMENDGTGSHLLGHANSVDYMDGVDTLITYGTNGSNKPTIVLYQNPDFSHVLGLSDAGCVVIPLYNDSGYMNVSGSVCFGEAPQIAYFIEGIYTDASSTINPVRNIYKLLLGMGSNDVSSGGYGTFISGKANNEYNGTCKIIKTYTGEIISGLHCFANANSLWTPQDMKFDGYLFVSYGTAGNNNLKIQLNNQSNTYRVVNNYHFEVLATNGDVVPCEPEMLVLYGNKMLCGVSDRSTYENYLYQFEMR